MCTTTNNAHPGQVGRMDSKTSHAKFEEQCQKLLGMTVADAGLDPSDVDRYVCDANSDSDIRDAVLTYASDYDLDVRGTQWIS